MKKLKKLTLNASKLEHSEMKKIRGGNWGGYACTTVNYINNGHTAYCSTGSGATCMNNSGEMGSCYIRNNVANKLECTCL